MRISDWSSDVCSADLPHRPAAFVLENVKNLESHDGGRTFATILNVLRNELKYHVKARVISSEPWVPQKRERIFIVGFRSEPDFDFDALEPPAKSDGPKLGKLGTAGCRERGCKEM